MGANQMGQQGVNTRISTKIISEIAEQDDLEPTDISPKLYSVIDTDSLESLFSGKTNGPVKIEFPYAGHHVTVRGDEIVQIKVE